MYELEGARLDPSFIGSMTEDSKEGTCPKEFHNSIQQIFIEHPF